MSDNEKCQNELVEWAEDAHLKGWAGVVGGLPILEVTACDSIMFGYTVYEYDGLECHEDWEREKKRLGKHFSEWLAKSSLVSVAELGELRKEVSSQKGIIQATKEMNHDLKVKTKGYEEGTHALIGIAELQALHDQKRKDALFLREIREKIDSSDPTRMEYAFTMIDDWIYELELPDAARKTQDKK